MSPPEQTSMEEDQPFTLYMYQTGQKVTGSIQIFIKINKKQDAFPQTGS